MGKYVNFLKCFDTALVVYSVTSGSIIFAWFISAIGTPVRLITSCVTINFV